MTLAEILPSVNAALNATSGLLVLFGRGAIRRQERIRHRAWMLSAMTVSAVFLVSYGIRVSLSGTHRFQGAPALKAAYLVILMSHMVLAAAIVPMILRTVYLALRGRFEAHKRIARWTYPIWLYVSVTGVLVYVLLFHVSRSTG